MCFDKHYDYHCEVNDEETITSEVAVRCMECHRMIPAGEAYYHLHQAEYETPRDWDEDGNDFDDPEVQADPSQFMDAGETYDYDRCAQCSLVLQAVEEAERAAGCTGDETTPYLGDLRQAIRDDDEGRYATRALTLSPEIGPHLPLLGWEGGR